MTRSLRLELVLTAIVFALSLVILFAIDFGLIGYSTMAQAQTAKGVVIDGMVFGVARAGMRMLGSLGLLGRIRKVLSRERSVLAAYILSKAPKQEDLG